MRGPAVFLTALEKAHGERQARRFDLELARLVHRLDGGSDEVALAAFLVSRQAAAGDVCIDLAAYAGRPLHPRSSGGPLSAPGLAHWRRSLEASPLVGGAGARAPLILDRGRLYLGRYWHYEDNVARALTERARRVHSPPEPLLLPELERLFPAAGETDWQRIASVVALRHGIGVISGGPGTGKTTTVAKVLALAVALAMDRAPRPPRIGLAAPTGKAAARLTESIGRIRDTLECPTEVRNRIPAEAMTLHRLLGYRPADFAFRHDRRDPLHLDLLVLDEASMIDLPLMSKLFDALPAHCSLILLGDKDQLASVEAGSVLGDICKESARRGYSRDLTAHLRRCHPGPLDLPAGESDGGAPIGDCIALLRKSYRFDDLSPVGRLARAINRGDAGGLVSRLGEAGDRGIRWISDPAAVRDYLIAIALPHFADALGRSDPEAALDALSGYRLLTALREGPSGVAALNRSVERLLAARGLIPAAALWYPGRPVLITHNDYALGLYNGDTGVALADPQAEGRLRVFFRSAQGGLRRLLPQRLPAHETAYAMTVHKSQGSELDHVALILPQPPSPLLTRELLYTAITRSRGRVDILASAEALTQATRTPTARASGLAEALWGG